MKVQRVAIDTLTPYPGNPRRGDVSAIAASIEANGIYKPIIVQAATNTILAGNHTWQAAKHLGMDKIDVVWADVDDATAKRIVLVDNATNDKATYDFGELKAILDDLDDITGTGYNAEDLEAITLRALEELDDPDDPDREPTTGELLDLADVTVAEPTHKVHHGDVWHVGHHILVIARVTDEHDKWRDLLTSDRKFAPYPEPYLTTTDLGRATPLLLVQPNAYLAGHLLDKHTAIFPNDTVVKT